MKKVFSNEMVLHTWAQQDQEEGRNSSGSFSFNGRYLTSYRTTVAIHYGDFVLVTANNFSPTTGKQISHLSTAVSPARDIYIDNIFKYGKDYSNHWTNNTLPTGSMIKKQLLSELDLLALEYTKKRTDNTRYFCKLQIENKLTDLYVVCKHFGLVQKYSANQSAESFLDLNGDIVAKLKKAEKAEKAKKQRAINKKKKEQLEEFNAFIAGESNHFPNSYRKGNEHYLTVWKNKVITSGFAEVPIEDAKKAIKLYKRVVASGQEWKRNGQTCKIGHFQLDQIDINGNARVGCHYFKAAELKRFIDQWF